MPDDILARIVADAPSFAGMVILAILWWEWAKKLDRLQAQLLDLTRQSLQVIKQNTQALQELRSSIEQLGALKEIEKRLLQIESRLGG